MSTPTTWPAGSPRRRSLEADANRPRVVILRGQLANPWELRPWEHLREQFKISVLIPRHHLHPLGSLELEQVEVRALSDLAPAGPSEFLARLPFNRHLKLERALSGADIVHVVDLHPWFSAQAAALRSRLGYRLLTTVWETLPFRAALRHRLSRPNRERVLKATDLFLPTTERAAAALRLEGVETQRMRVVQPGIDFERFAPAQLSRTQGEDPVLISPGRLVWEKGHQDVLRAAAALRTGLVPGPATAARLRILIVGSGPEERNLRAYAEDLGLGGAVAIQSTVPYDQMPGMYARATAMVLASLPTRTWEEQFGMVLVEAMAAGLPIITTTCGAIPEVVAPEATLVAPGDWLAIARALAEGPLRTLGQPTHYTPGWLDRFSLPAAAERIGAAYDAVLARPPLAAA